MKTPKAQHIPPLDPHFTPAALWNRAYRNAVEASGQAAPVALALQQPEGSTCRFDLSVLPSDHPDSQHSITYVERLIKFALWARGGNRVFYAGPDSLLASLREHYANTPAGQFDTTFIGQKIYGQPLTLETVAHEDIPPESQPAQAMGRHLTGCRIGFDLGGSDRKCAAVKDGDVVFSEEVEWQPYFETDPQHHYDGINASLRRAAEHLPHVDAIGGSAAGVYVNNEVRAASLFRGLSEDNFNTHIRRLFFRLQKEWNDVPFIVVNDGEVTALAGSMSLNDNNVLGIAMGTSQAAGYVNAQGNITCWLNELAFTPVDYRPDAPADEWSGDVGCGVQYFSQQAVARLAPAAGITLDPDRAPADTLKDVQTLMAKGDERAAAIYKTIGTYLGYSLAHYAEFYTIKHLLLLGRVTSGQGGEIIIEQARAVLKDEFPVLAQSITISAPDEKLKRHGQAIAAASLPYVEDK